MSYFDLQDLFSKCLKIFLLTFSYLFLHYFYYGQHISFLFHMTNQHTLSGLKQQPYIGLQF